MELNSGASLASRCTLLLLPHAVAAATLLAAGNFIGGCDWLFEQCVGGATGTASLCWLKWREAGVTPGERRCEERAAGGLGLP